MSILVTGGLGFIGAKVVLQLLKRDIPVVLADLDIEKNKIRAEQIASELSSSIVICGDPLDEKILKEANIEEVETVFALTEDDEDNIMAVSYTHLTLPTKA